MLFGNGFRLATCSLCRACTGVYIHSSQQQNMIYLRKKAIRCVPSVKNSWLMPFHKFPLIKVYQYLYTTSKNSSSIENDDTVRVIYIDRDGKHHNIKGKVGDNVMYLAQKHDIDVEGACEASLACCTCHVYVEKHFEQLNEIEEEEEDMLDLAPFLQENSRLSCQILLDKNLDGLIVRLPSATRNFYVDGHKPKPH